MIFVIEVYRVLRPDNIQFVASLVDGEWVEDNEFTSEYADLEGEDEESVARQFTGPETVAVIVDEDES